MSAKIPTNFPSKESENQPCINIPAPAPAMTKKDSGYLKITESGDHTVKIGADDNGSLTVRGQTVRVDPKGPQGGGKFRYSEEASVHMDEGFEKVDWEYVNIDYKPASGNVAKFEALMDGAQIKLHVLKGIIFLPVKDSPGGFDPAPSKAKNFIDVKEAGNKPFGIRIGVLFGDSKQPSQKLTASFSTGTGEFDPASLESDQDGFKKFIIKTKASSKKIKIRVNDAESEEHDTLPAVFKEPFHITVYYTPKESGCHDTEKKVDLNVAGHTVKVYQKFLKAVRMEGCGLLENPPVSNTPYIGELSWKRGDLTATAQAYAQPLGANNRVLTPLVSCAASKAQFPLGSTVKVCDADIASLLGGHDTWTIDDVGYAIGKNELDLYWGEDVPSANSLNIPAGLKQGINKYEIRVELTSIPS